MLSDNHWTISKAGYQECKEAWKIQMLMNVYDVRISDFAPHGWQDARGPKWVRKLCEILDEIGGGGADEFDIAARC